MEEKIFNNKFAKQPLFKKYSSSKLEDIQCVRYIS